MRSQEVAVYKEIQKNTEMAMRAIDIINDKIYDEDLSRQMSRQSLKYSEIHNQAVSQLLQAKAEPYHESHVENLMLAGAIHYNTLLNTMCQYQHQSYRGDADQGQQSGNPGYEPYSEPQCGGRGKAHHAGTTAYFIRGKECGKAD